MRPNGNHDDDRYRLLKRIDRIAIFIVILVIVLAIASWWIMNRA